MPRLRLLLLAAYLGAFLAVSTIWVIARLRTPGSFVPPPTPGWDVVWGRSFVQFRQWSAPVSVFQASDPIVQFAAPSSSGTTARAGSAPAGLFAYANGYYWERGMAWAFREIAFHYHVLWWLTAPAPLLAAVSYRRHKRRTRLATHRCIQCGYDLRATPDRCPECGTAAQ